MNEVVREWIDKSEGDYLTATREVHVDPPNYDAVCFHAQQCIEKLLKAAVIAKGEIPTKTHDLTILSGLWCFYFTRVPFQSKTILLLSDTLSFQLASFSGSTSGGLQSKQGKTPVVGSRLSVLSCQFRIGVDRRSSAVEKQLLIAGCRLFAVNPLPTRFYLCPPIVAGIPTALSGFFLTQNHSDCTIIIQLNREPLEAHKPETLSSKCETTLK